MFNIDDKLRYNKLYQWTKDRIRNTKYGVGNIVRWLPVIWKDRWWDSYFIYPILHKKLSMMEKHIRKDGNHVDSERDADQIKTCVLLLKRIMDDDYGENAFKKHEEKWGDVKMSSSPTENQGFSKIEIYYDNVITEEDKEQERKDFKLAIKQEEMLKKQDINLLFKLMAKHIRSWWD